jgi:membrane-bound metal-dependent hydrolase YbcI (DUF457 family)
MNTPTHALVGLALLARGAAGRGRAAPVVAGAVLPDAAMYVLFVVATFAWRQPQAEIWADTYFRPEWQHAVDALHAFPVLGAALAATYVPGARRAAAGVPDAGGAAPAAPGGWRRWVRLAAASALLHAAADLLVHAEDAHHHLWPVSAWRFVSPVSYWDPRHHGLVFAPLECAAALLLLPTAWRLVPGRTRWARAARAVLALLGVAYAAGLAVGTVRLLRGPAGAAGAGSLQGAVTGRR